MEIQWYPGHIAKAERQLKEQLKQVDVVLEIIDARIPLASHHPEVLNWIGSKPRVVVLNRMDMIPEELLQEWGKWWESRGEKAYFTDAKQGKGIKALMKATQKMGAAMNQRRRERGMRDRPVRAVVIGFPNVGKSALINRLVNRKVVASARRAGITRQLRWVRISPEIELLDAPGVIPGKLENQKEALKLAICDDIGEAAYDNQRVAAALVDLMVELNVDSILQSRYRLDPISQTGEEFVEALGNNRYYGDKERAALQLLNDFRKGLMGTIPLEFPPV
ncbi:MAG: ribosome biogenesis GTPase YlqF [Gomphosphaeria aponina SAG 52.96 = DSM 107014]|uniref:Ribosome biogenesis GTPase A n=1 Tax=Gomphosphaeria aponina SAG 52.96 = DSM 107014 TaxID=1521640 RepID=A0A941GSZ8_9CHRO|nr:ribosome biogenesis GTPase YlqF [Gomphosphaeria aponina SAG 52.96 = DSM 107014]